MPIRILNECLLCSIGPQFPLQPRRAARIEVRFIFVKIVDDQSEMPATMM